MRKRQLFHSSLSNGIKGGNWDLPSPGPGFLASRCLFCSADRFICCDDGTIRVKRIRFKLPDRLPLGGLCMQWSTEKTKQAPESHCEDTRLTKDIMFKVKVCFAKRLRALQMLISALCKEVDILSKWETASGDDTSFLKTYNGGKPDSGSYVIMGTVCVTIKLNLHTNFMKQCFHPVPPSVLKQIRRHFGKYTR